MKFQQVLKEEFYDTFKYSPGYSGDSHLVEITKNPTKKEFSNIMKKKIFTRGVLLKSGDLYLSNNDDIIHDDLLKILSKDNILSYEKFWYENTQLLNKYLCIHLELTMRIFPAESYRQEPYDLIEEKYLEIYTAALNKKNKIFKLEFR